MLATRPYDVPVTAAPLDLDSAAATSLADKAYVAIRDRLIMLDIRPGEPIDDGELARELGVGRTPVREALKRLEGDRLVVSFSRRGTFATGMDIADLAHIALAIERLSILAAIVIADEQRWDGQERSTRYQDFRKSAQQENGFDHDDDRDRPLQMRNN